MSKTAIPPKRDAFLGCFYIALGCFISGGLWFLIASTHGGFNDLCEAAGGTVDQVNRGFFCIRDGFYIAVEE